MLCLKPNPSIETFPVRIDIVSLKGESYSLEYIELVRQRAGSEEVCLTNEQQNTPIKIEITLNATTEMAHINFHYNLENPNVKQMLDCLRLQNALSKGFVITISHIADGLRLSKQTFTNGITEQPPKGLLKFLEALVFIQTKMNCLIVVPLRHGLEG